MSAKTFMLCCMAVLDAVTAKSDYYHTYLGHHAHHIDDYQVMDVYKRTDPTFIQGFFYDTERDKFVESTGMYGESKTHWLELNEKDGLIQPVANTAVPYDPTEFGEGISPLDDDTWIEMTWKERKVHLLDRDSLEKQETIEMWPGVKEGWGITLDNDNRILYVSDGSDKITTIDAETLEQTGQFTVKRDGKNQDKINELQFVDGFIWANIFYLNGMFKIDPKSGKVVDEIDFEILHDAEMKMVKELGQSVGYDHGNNVCNGIAYHPAEDAFYVTGKRWNLLFKIQLN